MTNDSRGPMRKKTSFSVTASCFLLYDIMLRYPVMRFFCIRVAHNIPSVSKYNSCLINP